MIKLTSVFCAATLAASTACLPAAASPLIQIPPSEQGFPLLKVDSDHHHHHHHHHGGDDWDDWVGIGAAILGGAIVGGYLSQPRYYAGGGSYHTRWCYNRYRSYRAWDNTFQPYNGPRRQCYSP